MIPVAVDRFQSFARIEHPTAGGAEDVPRHLEEPELGGMEKRSNRLLRIEVVFGRKRQGVDAVEIAIGSVLDQVLDPVYRLGVC